MKTERVRFKKSEKVYEFQVEVAENPKEYRHRTTKDAMAVANGYFLRNLQLALIVASGKKKGALNLDDEEAVSLFISEFRLSKVPGEKLPVNPKKSILTPTAGIAARPPEEQKQLNELLAKARAAAKEVSKQPVGNDGAESSIH